MIELKCERCLKCIQVLTFFTHNSLSHSLDGVVPRKWNEIRWNHFTFRECSFSDGHSSHQMMHYVSKRSLFMITLQNAFVWVCRSAALSLLSIMQKVWNNQRITTTMNDYCVRSLIKLMKLSLALHSFLTLPTQKKSTFPFSHRRFYQPLAHRIESEEKNIVAIPFMPYHLLRV